MRPTRHWIIEFDIDKANTAISKKRCNILLRIISFGRRKEERDFLRINFSIVITYNENIRRCYKRTADERCMVGRIVLLFLGTLFQS